MSGEIINKVESSGLITLDLETHYHQGERVVYDLKENLFQGLILKERDFRMFIKEHDWSSYKDKNVSLICSSDAVIQTWAYMLLVVALEPYAHKVVVGDLAQLENALFQEAISKIDLQDFDDAKVVVKGCSKFPVPAFAYAEITRLLKPHVKSIMFGEPCSTVPIFKKKD